MLDVGINELLAMIRTRQQVSVGWPQVSPPVRICSSASSSSDKKVIDLVFLFKVPQQMNKLEVNQNS